MSAARQSQDKYWYTVQVDTLRVWIFLGTAAVLFFGGVWGYSYFQRYLAQKRVVAALEEGRQLVQELRTEAEIMRFRTEFATGRESLETARESLLANELEKALTEAERGRSLLRSILGSLRDDAQPPEAQFIAIQGGVEFRRGERGEWLPARSRVALYPGDYVKTSGGGSAELMTVDGSLFTVRPDTVILVDQRRERSGNQKQRGIALRSGWVNLSTAQASSRVSTPEAEAVVARRSSASVSYDESDKLARFTSTRGELEITTRDGKTQRLGERQQVDQKESRLSQTRDLPEAPITLAPRDNLELFLSEAERVELSWEPVRGAVSYALQVSQNRLFVDNVIDVDGRAKTRATLGLQGEGNFIWRVAAADAKGVQGPWSMPRRFRVSEQPGSVDLSAVIEPQESAAAADEGGS